MTLLDRGRDSGTIVMGLGGRESLSDKKYLFGLGVEHFRWGYGFFSGESLFPNSRRGKNCCRCYCGKKCLLSLGVKIIVTTELAHMLGSLKRISVFVYSK